MAEKCECLNLIDNAMSNVLDQSRAKFRAEYDADSNLKYLGHTSSDKKEDETGWIIQKFEYNEKGCITANSFPKASNGEGNSYPNFKWSDREKYEYV